MKKYIIIICFLIPLALSSQVIEKGDILIKNGTVLTVTNGTLDQADIFIKDGKIHKIGRDLKATSDMEVIDASGMFVMPGIIDAHSHLGIDAVNEATSPVTAEVFVGDALNPFDVGLYRALAGGCTTSHAMHGSANAIGGQCETIKHRWGTEDPEVLRMKGAPRTIKFALGENPMRVHGEGSGIQPATRMGIEQVFRKAFSEAKQYKAEKASMINGVGPLYNERMEVLSDILDGKIIIHCHSYRADEIVMLMNVLKDFGVKKICFQHVNEGFKIAPELAEFGAGASVFADWWAYKFEVYYSTAYNAAILQRNGVITSINSDSRELIRHLYHEAAKTQKYGGLTDDEALALITLNPAKQLGIDNRVGSIEEGKDGDIAIFNVHPLSVYAIPQYTIVDGMVRFNINEDPHDMRLYVDPNEDIQTYHFEAGHGHGHGHDHDHDGCMQDVFETGLFEEKH